MKAATSSSGFPIEGSFYPRECECLEAWASANNLLTLEVKEGMRDRYQIGNTKNTEKFALVFFAEEGYFGPAPQLAYLQHHPSTYFFARVRKSLNQSSTIKIEQN